MWSALLPVSVAHWTLPHYLLPVQRIPQTRTQCSGSLHSRLSLGSAGLGFCEKFNMVSYLAESLQNPANPHSDQTSPCVTELKCEQRARPARWRWRGAQCTPGPRRQISPPLSTTLLVQASKWIARNRQWTMIGSNETSPHCSFRIRRTIKFSSLASYEETSYLFHVWQMMNIFSFIVVFLPGYLIVLSLFIEVSISILHLPQPVFPRPRPLPAWTMSLRTTDNKQWRPAHDWTYHCWRSKQWGSNGICWQDAECRSVSHLFYTPSHLPAQIFQYHFKSYHN